jgi:hypothetical protein
LTPQQVYEDQVRLQKESDQKKESEQKKKSENQREAEKNEREKENQSSAFERKSERKQKNFYTKVSEIKRAMFSNQPMIVLLYKEALLNTNELDLALPSSIVSLLQEYKDVFPEETPHGLQSEGLNIKLILFPVQPFQTDQLIGAILRRQRSFNGR